MKAVGVVCEYNPFHNGHEYHILSIRRELGEDAVTVCVMSGDFVQRGESAIFNKFARAHAACLAGADLVLELPLPWSIASAENFARAAVSILGAVGVDAVSFGSECGEIESLEIVANALLSSEINALICSYLAESPNMSYAAARQTVLSQTIGESAKLIESPNNILAVEYIKAVCELGLHIKTHTVKRIGSAHDAAGNVGPKSASELRRMFNAVEDISPYIPEGAMSVYEDEIASGRLVDRERMECALVSRLRALDKSDFEGIPDGGDGAGIRLYDAVRSANDIDAIIESAKTKRYAASRLRRALLSAALKVEKDMSRSLPPYARVLAANRKGTEYLGTLRKSATISILTKSAAVKEMSPQAQKVFELGASAHDLYALAYAAPGERSCGGDWRFSPVIIR